MKVAQELEKTLSRAIDFAVKMQHEFVTTEHLLYALTFDSTASKLLLLCDLVLEDLRKEIQTFFDNEFGSIQFLKPGEKPNYSIGFQTVLQNAALQSSTAEAKELNGANVLIALFKEKESHATFFLKRQGVHRLKLMRLVSQATLKEDVPEMSKFCLNLSKEVKVENAVIGRQKELSRIIHILSRKKKNNVLLVGEPGVGKTAIVEGLALAINQKEVPLFLQGRSIYSLSMTSLLSGTKFRGEFEERVEQLIQQLKRYKNQILFIDEMHTLVGAGAVSAGSLDISQMLKPVLTQGDILCIGATTYQDYRQSLEKDQALLRRFQKVDVPEPSIEESIEVLKGIQPDYEAYHHVVYMPEAIKACVSLTALKMRNRFLPDKAIDVMDEAGSEVKLSGESVVTVEIIEKILNRFLQLPDQKEEVKVQLLNLEASLKSVIYGQDSAIREISEAVYLSKAGLSDPEKPLGSFLFLGPTGVGKTEVVRQLAKWMHLPLIQFDMSEYSEKHAVSRLIGSPPGYVGYEQGGQLTESLQKSPHAVVLLDEIEKAHPDILTVLLQVMDYGTLTDNTGKKADFRNAILIMTSNAGVNAWVQSAVGFSPQKDELNYKSKKEVERHFLPEFRNRLTALIQFAPLSFSDVLKIAEKQLGVLLARLKEKNVTLSYDEAVLQYLAEKGYQPQFGARPMQRLIQDQIAKPLSKDILFGSLRQGGKVHLVLKKGGIVFMPLEVLIA